MALLGLALGQGLAAGALCGVLACPPLRARGARAYRAARGALLGGPGGAAGQAPLAGAGLMVVGAAAALLAGAAGLARAGLGLLLLGASGGGAAGARAALERDGWRAFALVLAALGAVGFGGAAYGLGELVLEAEGRAVREAPAGGVGGGGEAMERAARELRLGRERYREAAGAARRAAEAEEAAGRREEAMRRQAESTSREYARLSEENLALRDQLRQLDRRAASGAKKRE